MPKHVLSLAATGVLGLFIGLHVVLAVPSLWGYPGVFGGFLLFSLAVIMQSEGIDHV
ncbi:MAG: hypothetical protein ACYC9K_01035 [Sulfuricaulis sp.]